MYEHKHMFDTMPAILTNVVTALHDVQRYMQVSFIEQPPLASYDIPS